MNQEKIKELAKQAGYLPDMFGVGHWDMPEFKRFAELIVNECATILDTKIQPPSHPFNSIGYKLKGHFGVE